VLDDQNNARLPITYAVINLTMINPWKMTKEAGVNGGGDDSGEQQPAMVGAVL
jgi:hypothetical protein